MITTMMMITTVIMLVRRYTSIMRTMLTKTMIKMMLMVKQSIMRIRKVTRQGQGNTFRRWEPTNCFSS